VLAQAELDLAEGGADLGCEEEGELGGGCGLLSRHGMILPRLQVNCKVLL
jgi:hypothetical protein